MFKSYPPLVFRDESYLNVLQLDLEGFIPVKVSRLQDTTTKLFSNFTLLYDSSKLIEGSVIAPEIESFILGTALEETRKIEIEEIDIDEAFLNTTFTDAVTEESKDSHTSKCSSHLFLSLKCVHYFSSNYG